MYDFWLGVVGRDCGVNVGIGLGIRWADLGNCVGGCIFAVFAGFSFGGVVGNGGIHGGVVEFLCLLS